jgi:protein-disulfide isomerase
MNKTLILAAAVVALGAAGAYFYAGRPGAGQSPVSVSATAQEATASSAVALVPDMILGKVDAPVTVIEYASYTCPHCQRFHEESFGQLKANYIDTGKVKFVYREVYFDKFGLWAAMVARCGGPEKYFGISDMLYDGQKEWLASGEEAGIADALRKIGLKAGLTAEAVEACLNDKAKAQSMVEVYQANATADQVEGTPTFIIDGEKYSNMSYEEFAKVLDEKLAN